MKILVKAAHKFTGLYYSRQIIRKDILRYSDDIDPKVALRALKLLEIPMDKGNDDLNLVQRILEDCSSKDRPTLNSLMTGSLRLKVIRPSSTIKVEPGVTIGGLKSIMKQESWTPKENLELFRRKGKRLEDESSILHECGVKEGDTLMVCSGGSFLLGVVVLNGRHGFFHITISNCFQTVGDVKDMIYQKIGYPPNDQKLFFDCREAAVSNVGTRLVDVGIVKPYWTERATATQKVRLLVPKLGGTEHYDV